MLPVVDKPLIQYAAEEAIDAGIDELIFVTGRNKRSIEDHFDKAYELEAELAAKNKQDLLKIVQNILPSKVSCVYIRQPEALGLGHAVLCAKQIVGDDPFAVILADDLISHGTGVVRQMVELYNRHHCSVIGVENIPREDTGSYGIVKASPVSAGLYKMESIVRETQAGAGAFDPGCGGPLYSDVGHFRLPRKVRWRRWRNTAHRRHSRAASSETVYAYEFAGKRYDCGNKFDYLQATVEYALEHPELKDRFRAHLKSLKP